jgi:mevalonate kinase
MQLKASAPGSLMLLGEYAVLYGKPALVCAIDKRITVNLTPRQDQRIEIQSATHGQYLTELVQLEIKPPFQFVLSALKQFQGKLKYGCTLEIISEFSDKMGFGSSAAVTVATLTALYAWLNMRISAHNLIRQGRQVVLHVQGVGSGADIAAAVHGGMVHYQAQPLIAEKLSATYPLTAWYAGYKTPTVEAIKQVQTHFADHPQLFKQLTNSIGQCAMEGVQCVRKAEWQKLGEIMNVQQGLMESLGVNTPQLRERIEALRAESSVLGAKISGSGLGDCVVGLGSANVGVPLAMSLQGVHCEKS